jgi:hypothetical protein
MTGACGMRSGAGIRPPSSIAGVACYRPGDRPHLFYKLRVYRRRKGEAKGFSWAPCYPVDSQVFTDNILSMSRVGEKRS